MILLLKSMFTLILMVASLKIAFNSTVFRNQIPFPERGAFAPLSPFAEKEFFIEILLVRIHYHRDD